MGAGIHGKNGLNPIVSRKIWERYNIPRSTHGMEVQIYSNEELLKFQRHETKFLKMFQTLPKFGTNVMAYVLVGGRPAISIIHQRMLSLLMNIRRKNGLEADLGRRQLAMKKSNSLSWFHRVNKVANLYGIPNGYTIMNELPWDKNSWKNV